MTQKLKNTGSGEEVSHDEGVRLAPEPPGALRSWPPHHPKLATRGWEPLKEQTSRRSIRPPQTNCASDCCCLHLPPVPADDSPGHRSAPGPAPTFESATAERAPPGPSGTRGLGTRGLRAGRAGPAGFKRVAGGAQQLGGRGWGRDARPTQVPRPVSSPPPSSYWLTLDSPPSHQGVALLSPQVVRRAPRGPRRERRRRLSVRHRCSVGRCHISAGFPGPKVPAGVTQGFPMSPPAAGTPTLSPRPGAAPLPFGFEFPPAEPGQRRRQTARPGGRLSLVPRGEPGDAVTLPRFRVVV